MIFAAGLGTRLRPLTDDCPKALVEVGGVPMLERVITHLRECGFDRIIVNVHHYADMVIDFLKKNDFWRGDSGEQMSVNVCLIPGAPLSRRRNGLTAMNRFLYIMPIFLLILTFGR